MGEGVALNELVGLALAKLKELVQIPLDQTSPDFPKLASLQKDASVALLNTAVKVDETRLKARATNSLERLSEKVIQHQLTH